MAVEEVGVRLLPPIPVSLNLGQKSTQPKVLPVVVLERPPARPPRAVLTAFCLAASLLKLLMPARIRHRPCFASLVALRPEVRLYMRAPRARDMVASSLSTAVALVDCAAVRATPLSKSHRRQTK